MKTIGTSRSNVHGWEDLKLKDAPDAPRNHIWDIELEPANGAAAGAQPWAHLNATPQENPRARGGELLAARGRRVRPKRPEVRKPAPERARRRSYKVAAWAVAMVLVASVAYALVDNSRSGNSNKRSQPVPSLIDPPLVAPPTAGAAGSLELAPATAAALPALTAADVTVPEGNSGETTADFTVTLAGPLAQKGQVDYATANESALAEADYRPARGTLVFEPGQTSLTLKVALIGDTQAETDEQFFINFTNPVGVSLPDPQAAARITNDDPGVPTASSISISDVRVKEGDRAVFVITISPPSPQAVSINYATANGSAVAPGDFGPGSGTINFKARETKAELAVATIKDDAAEPDENFTVNLSGPVNVALADAQGQATITEGAVGAVPAAAAPAPAGPGLRIDDTVQPEGGSVTDFAVTVSLSAPAGEEVSVDFATSPGSAVEGSDYAGASGTLRFARGETQKTILIKVLGDATKESDETFLVTLTGEKGAPVADNQAQVTIQNDD